MPAPKTTERYLVQQALNWTASELHASVGGLFNPTLSAEVKAYLVTRTEDKIKKLCELMLKDGRAFLVGGKFTVADSYTYIVLSWMGYVGIDMGKFPAAKAYFDGIAALPQVKAAHARMAEKPAATL